MHCLSKALLGAAALPLVACTTAPATQETAPPAAAAAAVPAIAAKSDDEAMTGSRIRKKGSGDRTVHTVGARDARDSFDNMAKPMDR